MSLKISRYAPWCTLIVMLLLLATCYIQPTLSLRLKLLPEEEPEGEAIYNNLRMVFGSDNYYFLESAGLLKDSDIPSNMKEDKRDHTGQYIAGNFKFNSSEFIRKALSLKWYIPYEERVSIHVYDNPHDRDLATGPQVNQELCGLHLDYMLHLINTQHQRFENATELSIFKIMDSFDSPGPAFTEASTSFLGSYKGCTRAHLNVMKKELYKVNQTAAKEYFTELNKEDKQQSIFSLIVSPLITYIGPFFGFPISRDKVFIENYSEEIHLLPMRYCFSRLKWPTWPNNTHYSRTLAIETAACLPETCDSNSMSIHGDKIKQLVDTKVAKFFSNFYIDSLYCLPDERSQFRNPFYYTSTIWFFLFNAIWFTLVIVATAMHKFETETTNSSKKGWQVYLNSWNLIKNFNEFKSPKRSAQIDLDGKTKEPHRHQVNMDALEGIKVFSAISVITSHAIIIAFGAVWNPSEGEYLISQSWLAIANLVCPSIVDNFFVITGIVTGLTLYQLPRSLLTSPSYWFKFVIYRYIRIVPLYLLTHWFMQTVMRFIGSGPLWDYGSSYTAWSQVCQQESWWTILLPQANFKSPASHCLAVGWYLANDILFSLFTPFIIILYIKKPSLGHTVTIGMAFTIMFNHVRYYYMNAKDPKSVFEWSVMTITRVLDDTTAGYVNPQYRSIAFLLGIAAGYVLNEYRKGVIQRWPRTFLKYGKLFLFLVFYLLCFTPFITTLLPLDHDTLIRILAATFEGLLHGITSIASVIFTLLLCTGYFPTLQSFYSLHIFKNLAATGLSTLLVHIPLIFYHVQTLRTLPELNFYHVLVTTLIWVVESFILAIVVYLLYELPLRKFLLKIMFRLFDQPSIATIALKENEKYIKDGASKKEN